MFPMNKDNVRDVLELLDKLLSAKLTRDGKEKRSNRLRECLRPPDNTFTEGWHVCLPKSFNDALDIKQTVLGKELIWTQGSCFSFKQGDVIYDAEAAYLEWTQAFKFISFCIQITSASDSTPQSAESPRNPGAVNFTVYKPNKDKTGMEAVSFENMTHDEFVRFLIAGKG
jgi:hypothetical protein